jgi:hypothetical protein
MCRLPGVVVPGPHRRFGGVLGRWEVSPRQRTDPADGLRPKCGLRLFTAARCRSPAAVPPVADKAILCGDWLCGYPMRWFTVTGVVLTRCVGGAARCVAWDVLGPAGSMRRAPHRCQRRGELLRGLGWAGLGSREPGRAQG